MAFGLQERLQWHCRYRQYQIEPALPELAPSVGEGSSPSTSTTTLRNELRGLGWKWFLSCVAYVMFTGSVGIGMTVLFCSQCSFEKNEGSSSLGESTGVPSPSTPPPLLVPPTSDGASQPTSATGDSDSISEMPPNATEEVSHSSSTGTLITIFNASAVDNPNASWPDLPSTANGTIDASPPTGLPPPFQNFTNGSRPTTVSVANVTFFLDKHDDNIQNETSTAVVDDSATQFSSATAVQSNEAPGATTTTIIIIESNTTNPYN